MNNRITNLLEMSAYGIIESIRNNIHGQFENGEEITRSTVENLIDSTTEIALSENE